MRRPSECHRTQSLRRSDSQRSCMEEADAWPCTAFSCHPAPSKLQFHMRGGRQATACCHRTFLQADVARCLASFWDRAQAEATAGQTSYQAGVHTSSVSPPEEEASGSRAHQGMATRARKKARAVVAAGVVGAIKPAIGRQVDSGLPGLVSAAVAAVHGFCTIWSTLPSVVGMSASSEACSYPFLAAGRG